MDVHIRHAHASRVRWMLFEVPLIFITITLCFGAVNTIMNDKVGNYIELTNNVLSTRQRIIHLYL